MIGILNPGESGVTGGYDWHSYDAEKGAALDFWDRQVAAIVNGRWSRPVGRPRTVLPKRKADGFIRTCGYGRRRTKGKGRAP